LAQDFISHLGYLGIVAVLVLGGLGLPVPEEAPIILGGVLASKGRLDPALAFLAGYGGVILGDLVVYGLGYWHGERVLGLPMTRRFLSKPREVQLQGYFHRHGMKILVLCRFAPGFRSAAYLTAGILRLPPLRLLACDLVAAGLSTSLMFGAGFFFSRWIETTLEEMKRYALLATACLAGGFLLYRYTQARLRGGRAVGPPVPVTDEVPVPPDDLQAEAHARGGPGDPPAHSPAVNPS
jgi:membrane protein DedA with SNARE-associated domain